MPRGKPSGRYTQAARLHNVIRLLESRNGMTLDELVEETGVDLRTVHRDLAAVQEAGYPLTTDWQEGKKVYRFLTRTRQVPPITFTLDELVSLHLLRSCAGLLPPRPFGAEIDALFAKIHAALPPRSVAHLERISRVSLPRFQGVRDYSGCEDLLAELRRALLYQYRIRISYTKGGREAAAYELDPYTLVLAKGGLYLLALAHNRGGIRLFAVERIIGLEVTRKRFELPEDFDPEACFSDAFGLVTDQPMALKVRFDAQVAHLVRDRIWRSGQRMTAAADGSVQLAFEAAGTLEILAWILSFGSHAELLEPPMLRKELRRHIKGLRELYRKKS
ncbi:helix-turn-helix transcriptional regulator [Trichlorobacter ammonificans]|uniref:Helix-turn-helix type 11 domain protein n=1 Tax=Trichlorobacter ammonificans TaxID=2916410 RepID=A0ABN8HHV1_9BACT|nr:transcriptional regulator [Trichlorobacter ammonificans]CAH2032302.1 Helix-turn-helix type 11 domain protein [Trichlorobacter ammonificans]